MTTTAKPPTHLKPATKRWYRETIATFELEPHHLRLLTLAAEAWDRCQAAREVLDRDGVSYVDRFDAPRARPEVAVERDSRIAFARLMREIGLDAGSPEGNRPPTLKY